MRSLSTIAAFVFSFLFWVSAADAIVSLNFTDPIFGYSNGDLENNGMFTYSNVEGSGIDVTITIGSLADVNDSINTGGLKIGQSLGIANGATHSYTFSFSQPVDDVDLDISNINFGNVSGFVWNDQLTFDPGVTFSGLTDGVTSSGNTVLPVNSSTLANIQRATANYGHIDSSFTVVHGLGSSTSDPSPGHIRFLDLRFSSVPEPHTAVIYLLSMFGFATKWRRHA